MDINIKVNIKGYRIEDLKKTTWFSSLSDAVPELSILLDLGAVIGVCGDPIKFHFKRLDNSSLDSAVAKLTAMGYEVLVDA